jgi:hypothetical protein
MTERDCGWGQCVIRPEAEGSFPHCFRRASNATRLCLKHVISISIQIYYTISRAILRPPFLEPVPTKRGRPLCLHVVGRCPSSISSMLCVKYPFPDISPSSNVCLSGAENIFQGTPISMKRLEESVVHTECLSHFVLLAMHLAIPDAAHKRLTVGTLAAPECGA